MGRRKKRPTKVLSIRISKKEYDYIKALADRTGISISQAFSLYRKGRL